MAAASLDDKIQSLFLDCEPEFKSYFDKLDQDKSGNVDKLEFFVSISHFIKAMHPSKSLKDISAEIKTWFDLMDLDNDDQISWIEFWGVLARPPFLPTEATYKRVIGFFKSWKAPVAKFERAVQRLLADNEIRRKYLALESKFREAFDRMDTDKSGFIDKTEFVSFIMPFIKHQCAGLAFHEEELLNEVDRRFSIMDVNMDQKVSWPEFWAYFSSEDMIPDATSMEWVLSSLKSYGIEIH